MPAAVEQAHEPTRRPRLLVAHGEPVVREGLAGILQRRGYEVDQANDSDGALALLDKGAIDVLVVSLRLPPHGCLALLDACETSPPTVVLNGDMDDTAAISADPRVQSVLTRPFPLQALYDAVAKAAGGSGIA